MFNTILVATFKILKKISREPQAPGPPSHTRLGVVASKIVVFCHIFDEPVLVADSLSLFGGMQIVSQGIKIGDRRRLNVFVEDEVTIRGWHGDLEHMGGGERKDSTKRSPLLIDRI